MLDQITGVINLVLITMVASELYQTKPVFAILFAILFAISLGLPMLRIALGNLHD